MVLEQNPRDLPTTGEDKLKEVFSPTLSK